MRSECWLAARMPLRETASVGVSIAAADVRLSSHSHSWFPAARASREDRLPAPRAQADEPERCYRNSWLVSASGLAACRAGGRAPEQFLRLERNLHRGRDVRGGIRLDHGKEPPLVLH